MTERTTRLDAGPAQAPAERPRGPLARYHEALPCLAVLLRGADLPLGPDRWQNIYDLLLALAAQGRLPDHPGALQSLIAPLVCRTAREQQAFGPVFAGWVAGVEPAPTRATHGAGPPRLPAPPAIPRLRWWLLGLCLLLAALIGGLYGYNLWRHLEAPATPPAPVSTPASTEPRPVAEPTRPEVQTPAVLPKPKTRPPRAPRLEPVLDPDHQARFETLGHLCLLLPAFFALAWLLLRWLTWQTLLERRRGNPDDPLTAIGLPAPCDDLLDAPALREALKRLHAPVALTSRRLDADATVARTARRGGLFDPVLRQRRRVPDLVVLVEGRHAGDQMAGLAGALCERLREAGLHLHRYDYRDSPRRVVGPDGCWLGLADLAARHAGARLLLVGEPAALIDPLDGVALPWTTGLAAWPERGLLVTRRPPERWEAALAAAGFLVAEMNSAGIETLALHLGDHGSLPGTLPPATLPNVTVTLPRLLQDSRRWVQCATPPTADKAALIGCLDAYLGADGTRLLAAMAAYPALHWGLTRALDLSLFPRQDPLGREHRLIKVARLPWARAGWLPDWLRLALLERLGRTSERHIRHIYRVLLQAETIAGSGRIALPIGLPRVLGFWAGSWDWLVHRAWRPGRWLRGLRALSDEHGLLKDAIFADVLFGWRPRLLDFTLARRLLRRRLAGALGQALAPRLVLALSIALAGAWLADRAWNRGGLRERVHPHMLAWQKRNHQAWRVGIRHRAETADLADALEATLAADGFGVEHERAPVAQAAGPAATVHNRVLWADPGDQALALHIGKRLSGLASGEETQVSAEAGDLPEEWGADRPPRAREIRVWVLTTGVVDEAPQVEATIAPDTTLVETPEPGQAQTAAPRDYPSATSFRDTLRDGGQGPEMVQIPAGSFLMGSPDNEPERDTDEQQHRVKFKRPFAMGKYEVTFDEYDRFAKATGRELPADQGWGRKDRPVIDVGWGDAIAYVDWLSKQTGKGYRLPTEAEWEYAARARTTTVFSTGDCIDTSQANYDGNVEYAECHAKTGLYLGETQPVGQYPANLWGLHDMHGNVWEWLQDCFHHTYVHAPRNGSAWTDSCSDSGRVLRGGSWDNAPEGLRAANRNGVDTRYRSVDLGFRVARTLTP